MRKKKFILIVSAILACCLCLLSFGGCSKREVPKSPDGGTDVVAEPEPELFDNKYVTDARVGYYTEQLGTVARRIPTGTDDGGLECGYPRYGTKKALTAEQKNDVLAETASLCAGSSTYTKMDADGNLYFSDGTPANSGANKGKLYKHSASVGMYGGDVSDDEPGVIKRITFAPRPGNIGYSVTGLYAPAGEVVKVEMTESEFLKTGGGITIHIGQALYNGQNNNIWAARDFVRMPVILNTMTFNAANSTYDAAKKTYTCYIGSYLGGPIYVRSTKATVTVTFSGAVNYRHFILGKTTEAEFNELCKSTAPYFDLEVWDNGVLHSGPLAGAVSRTYEELYKAAILWDKVSDVSTQVSKQGIVFLYDPFVAAGAAVAFVGRSSVNCPAGWMASALNYDLFIQNGNWGNMHEYNHNFQSNWGLPGGGEVTNNALNLVSYSQFTRVSAARTLTSSGHSGLSGWNTYTNAGWALERVLARDYGGTNQLSIYSTLLHNIGAANFMRAARGGTGVKQYYNSLVNATGYDMTYFFRDMLALDPGDDAVNAVAAKKLPMFVPVSCTYQTGRSVVADGGKQYIQTMQPYTIEYGKAIDIDLSRYELSGGFYSGGSIDIPAGFSYTVKKVSRPESGSFTKKSGNVYTYTPSTALSSGKIIVTLGIVKDDSAFQVADVDLVLEFHQTHEINKSILKRTVYTYDSNNAFADAKAAYEAGYAGYLTKTVEDNKNPTQNSNTDIWVPDPADKAIMEVEGKLYVASDGDYRIALRGRKSCALFISLDGGKTYTCAASYTTTNTTYKFRDSKADAANYLDGSYMDLYGLSAGQWVYFKEVLKVDYNSAFIGLGWGRIETNGTIDEDGNFVDENGNVIDPEQARTVSVSYANGYKTTYEFETESFSSEYLFKKQANYTYDNSINHACRGSLVSSSGFTPWDATKGLDNLFDADDTNKIHSKKGSEYDITPENPFDITVDLGETVKATTVTIYGEPSQANYIPKDFVLYGGTSVDGMHVIKSVTNAERSGSNKENIVLTFPEETIRYYRLVCTATYKVTDPAGSRYIAMRAIKFSYPFRMSNGRHKAPDIAAYYGDWSVEVRQSHFGRVYYGKSGGKIELSFDGIFFGIFSYTGRMGSDFKVYIDGLLMPCAPTGAGDDATALAYLSDRLGQGSHKVKIVCRSDVTIQSFIFW